MSGAEKLLMEKDGPIGWIIFNQPEKRNAVSPGNVGVDAGLREGSGRG